MLRDVSFHLKNLLVFEKIKDASFHSDVLWLYIESLELTTISGDKSLQFLVVNHCNFWC